MIIAVIPAKKDSSRLPDKNMRRVLGKTLIEHAVDYGKRSERVSRLYVSTDDPQIKAFAESLKVEGILRSKHLSGEAPLIDVYRHALETLGHEGIQTVVGLQADHPDRTISLDQALDKFEKDGLDFLYSKDAKGQKNGAHTIMSAVGLLNNRFDRSDFIIDDCTNIHFESELRIAEERLMSRGNAH